MKLINTKFLFSSALIATMISGCAQKTGNETYDQNQNAIIGTTLGAIAGVVLGNNVGGGSKSRNKVIGAVAGAAIGGANEKVMDQLRLIGDVKNVPTYIAKAKDKNDPFRLMGFGHRVYKNRDPRAETLKGLQDKLKEELKLDSKLLDIAHAVEQAALSDDYFKERGLYPNIDFYSGVILTALKIPVEMFTPIFVIGRTPGWLAQWSELKQDPKHKIARPRQLYTGN